MAAANDVTQLLRKWQEGDLKSLDQLLPLVYADLRYLAAQSLRNNSGHATLQPTALVNEVFVRLLGAGKLDITNRFHLFATAAQLMRQVLIDRARAHQRAKRGGGALVRLEFDDLLDFPVEESSSLIAMHEALEQLEALDPRMAQIVELRYFAGLSVAEVAVMLEVQERTVYRQWAMARAWLRQRMES